ncbi:oligosaccharide flippase family protein [Lichenicola cladoniae]|uniref:Oligosaccharide flippase family protein n=1 Tax=Lichenicola cladoniae TaxID=1484109 RepID=A0A6M8GY98_9PROT|nr:oligosaccharide flippase family protein [Lichenicola cladoniae]NPD65194.1 oligosaccharide flippase family protein [Acetobacteraceae bacterium]QKE88794.1 oligosaccharide flippase family protein [Lichenicola cladoniae]
MTTHHRLLGTGFNWLAGATVIAKIVDFATILIMLLYLSKQQVGIASLVVSIAMVVEALNGLGTGEALIQARSVSRLQLDTLFWYVVGASLLVGSLTLLAAPWIGALYGFAGLGAYFTVVAAKQPLVGAALIPIAMMSRDLQYRRIAIVNVCATLAASFTRLGLGACGAGTWALVAGYSASGLYTLIGAVLARPFRPRLRFQFSAIRPLVRFGFRSAAANVSEQMFKNVDYMLIGLFYGPSQLAIYRVAFDIAMEPAMAVGTLVNRTTLPVIARVALIKRHLAETFLWGLERIAVLVLPLTGGLMFAAYPLTSLLHDHQGISYVAAALPLQILSIAALLRVSLLLLSTVMIGSGRPGMAARLSLAALLLLSMGILVAGFACRAQVGIVAVSAVWLAIYPLLLAWGARYLYRDWNVSGSDLWRHFKVPFIAVGMMIPVLAIGRLLIGGGDPRLLLALDVVVTASVYFILYRQQRKRSGTPR